MDGQEDSYQNPLDMMMLLNLGRIENHVSYGDGDDLTQQFDMTNSLPLPHSQWFYCQTTPTNYYEFLNENSSLIGKTPTHLLEGISQSVTDSHLIEEDMTVVKTELLDNNPGRASGSDTLGSSPDMDAWKLNLNPYIFNTDNHEDAHTARISLKQYDEREPMKKCKSLHHRSQFQSHASWEKEPSEVMGNVPNNHPRAKVAQSVFLPKPSYNASRQRVVDRQRRERIAERLKALNKLVPQQVEGSQSNVLDNITDYIKFLQLQMKELSRNRLVGEVQIDPSIFPEIYHHNIVNEQSMNEPLEDMMARLLEANSSAATNFLERKGLFIMPMDLADTLFQQSL